MEQKPFISIVSPVYGAAEIIQELVRRLTEELNKITDNYEIVLIEDHSPDDSWKVIREICATDPNVKGVKLSRNFGQHNAIGAGLHIASGDYVVVMDCDLQDDPSYIADLWQMATEGNDVVYTVKKERKHNAMKDFFAGMFHKLFNNLVGVEDVHTDGKIGSYSLITRKVVDAYKELKDEYRPYLVMLNLLGFQQGYLVVEHAERFSGRSSYSFKKLVVHALNGIISQTDRLLMLSVYIGILYVIASFLFGAYVLIQSLVSGFRPGWASLVLLLTFNTGILMLFLGIIGLYISRIFLQAKGRPLYIVDQTINLKK